MYDIFTQQEVPNAADSSNLVKWRRNNANVYSVFLDTNEGGIAILRCHEQKTPNDVP